MDELNRSYEPMDIDLSASSEKPMDISYNQLSDTDYVAEITPVACNREDIKPLISETVQSDVIRKTQIKKYQIKAHKIKPRLHKIIISFVLFVSLAIIIQRFFNEKCTDTFDFLTIRKVLISKLYGQDAAIDLITKTLELEESKILFLYGSTGVGKTYAVSLIFDSIWESANIYHYPAASFMHSFSPNLLIGMTFCKKSIFIIDNLNHDDMNTKETINDLLIKSEDLNKIITVILIYNCDSIKGEFMKKCDNTFRRDLENYFATIKIKKVFIPFESLREEHLKKCIETELGNRKLTKRDYDNIAQNFNVSSDGCKGVYPKMKFMNLL